MGANVQQSSSTHVHEWTPIGRHAQHAKIGTTVLVHYLRCACGWTGFTRPHSRVVYTWSPDPADWITE